MSFDYVQNCTLLSDNVLYTILNSLNIENEPGIKIGGKIINNIRYADDRVLIAATEKELQTLVDIINDESEKMGLSLNAKKTETMVISKKTVIPQCKVNVNGSELKQVYKFKYLGAYITSDGRCNTEVKSRIAQAKTVFNKMRSILTNLKLSKIQKRVLGCC